MTKQKLIIRFLRKGMSVKDITQRLGVPASSVYTTKWKAKKKTKTKPKQGKPYRSLTEALIETKDDLDSVLNKDRFKSPAHYTVGGIETWDFIEAKRLNYNLGSVVKYISRADFKDDYLSDLKKAREFLDREIKRQEKDYEAL